MDDPGVVEIRLFGGVRAVASGGGPVDVGPAKCQAVLAALALTPGMSVPVRRLVELVWGEQPPRTAGKTLQSYVTRLRKGLGPDAIVRVGAAYRLDLPAEAVDVVRFQRLLAEGDVDAALAEWIGPPLAGLETDGLAAATDGLVEQWLGAVEAQLSRQVEQDAAAVVGRLTELTADHPFREGLWALLMTALYRVGRQADALAAYRRAREQLVEHLGVEPGPRLRELESMILGHDATLAVDRAPGPAGGQPTGTVTFGFAEVEDSSRLWAAHRSDTAAAMARHDDLVRATADRHGGYVFATGGDSFGVAFHRARDGVAWAGELQAVTRAERWPGDVAVRVRIGLHTGETQERGRGYFGPAVLVAARLASVGHGGQTLVSGATASLLDPVGGYGTAGDGLADLHELGSYRLPGVVAEQRVLQLGEAHHPPLRTEGRAGNLPRRTGRLVGRDEDLEVVAEALAAAPVVTLVGPGGIGKTRLAVAAARRSEAVAGGAGAAGGAAGAGGAWLVELAGIASPDDVARAAGDVLAVREGPGRTLTESLVSVLGSRPALLLLDNCEHVIDGAAALARAVAEGCPNVRVLATSREGLGLGNGLEQLVVVAPLDPAGPGVELFVERAAAVAPTFDPQADRDYVEEICRRLDGVPLAIELAAARVRSLAPADLVARLDDRLRLLTGGRRTSVERHRTLRATIQWSYDLLSRPERVLFQRLSIFAGPFDLAAAEAVATGNGPGPGPAAGGDGGDALAVVDVDDLLGGLVDRSMVVVESGPFGRRFRLLETMRQFAAEDLSAGGHTDRVAARHARWCLDQVTRIRQLLAGPAEIEGVARLGELWPNLRAAVDWACATGDRHLARALVGPVVTEVYVRSQSEIGDWLERILALTPPDDGELVVYCLTWAARRYMRALDGAGYERLLARWGAPAHPMLDYARAFIDTDYPRMAAVAPQAAAELRRQGDDYAADLFDVVATGLSRLLAGWPQEHDEVVGALAERFREGGPPTGLHLALTQLGLSASMQGRPDEAWRHFDEASRVAVPERTHSLRNPLEARAALRRGNPAAAFRLLGSYVDELLDHDNVYLAKLACSEFVALLARAGKLAEVVPVLTYLETSGALDPAGTAPYRTLVAEATALLAATPTRPPTGVVVDDDRQALHYIRTTLASSP
jgi:predicted ATPase/DNA-binding SARP family transcriptional activator